MLKLIKANIAANLLLCRRNRLVLLIAIFFLFILATSLIPSLIFRSTALKFEIISLIFMQVSGFITFFSLAVALLLIFYPLNRRCLKIVITKPCPLEVWLLSILATALLISFTLHLLNLLIALILFCLWHIPIQAGVFYLAVDALLESAIMIAVLIFLVSVFHPFIAVLLMAVVNEHLFHYLLTLIMGGLEAVTITTVKSALQIGYWIAYGFYLILPSYGPYSHQKAHIHSSLRLEDGDLSYLGLTFVYACLLGLACYFLTCLVLKSKRHT